DTGAPSARKSTTDPGPKVMTAALLRNSPSRLFAIAAPPGCPFAQPFCEPEPCCGLDAAHVVQRRPGFARQAPHRPQGCGAFRVLKQRAADLPTPVAARRAELPCVETTLQLHPDGRFLRIDRRRAPDDVVYEL